MRDGNTIEQQLMPKKTTEAFANMTVNAFADNYYNTVSNNRQPMPLQTAGVVLQTTANALEDGCRFYDNQPMP